MQSPLNSAVAAKKVYSRRAALSPADVFIPPRGIKQRPREEKFRPIDNRIREEAAAAAAAKTYISSEDDESEMNARTIEDWGDLLIPRVTLQIE